METLAKLNIRRLNIRSRKDEFANNQVKILRLRSLTAPW
jgi:hypothetical protein